LQRKTKLATTHTCLVKCERLSGSLARSLINNQIKGKRRKPDHIGTLSMNRW